MSGNAYPTALRRVIQDISKWPGVGEKSAARMALHLLRAPKEEAVELAQALLELKEKIQLCRRCYAFADQELCPICADPGDGRGSSWWWPNPATCWPSRRWGGTRGFTMSWVA